jgi:hypothetical protein
MQCPNSQRGAQARHQTIETARGLRERNGVCGQRRLGIDGDQREIGLGCGDLFRKRRKTGLNRLGHGDENRGRLQLRDGAWGVGPDGVDDREQLRIVKRARERGPSGGPYGNDRSLLRNLQARATRRVERSNS